MRVLRVQWLQLRRPQYPQNSDFGAFTAILVGLPSDLRAGADLGLGGGVLFSLWHIDVVASLVVVSCVLLFRAFVCEQLDEL